MSTLLDPAGEADAETIAGVPAPALFPHESALDVPVALPPHPDGTAAALAAFALVLARHRGEDEVVVRVHTPSGSASLRIGEGGNPPARSFVATVRAALESAAWEDDDGRDDAPSSAARTFVSGGDDDHGAAASSSVAGTFVIGGDDDPCDADCGTYVAGEDDGDDGRAASGAVVLRVDADGGVDAAERSGGPVAGRATVRLDAARYDAESAARFAAHLQVVLHALAEAPERRIIDLPLLTGEETETRRRWNATDQDLPHSVLLHQAFERWADAAPGAVAIVHGGRTITYGEVEARANRLANHLRRRGIGPESRVGICVERGPRVLEAILGVLKAGGAYVPLDATYPPERLARMRATAGVRLLIAESATAAAAGDGETLLLDRDGAVIGAESAARPNGSATPENLAYVIFTSGSTGEPKGIALRHRGVMNNLADLNERHSVGPRDRVLLLSSLSFDLSVYETLGIVAAGGAVVIPLAHELRDPGAWAALCRAHSVTVWSSAPALLGMLADHVDAHPNDAPRGLRLAFLGGDWVPLSLASRVRAWAPAMRDFIVMGGATEASIHSTIQPVGAVDPAWRSIPYGVPMANQHAYVLDRHFRELPIGVAGELFLGGIGLARGYTGRAGLTAERFLPSPHGQPGARMYRTGDRARRWADGTIELLGRIDHQLKLRGLRIEPGEIEAALGAQPGVARALVIARDDGGERRLVAYLVPADAARPPDPRAVRDALRDRLPDYMVPAAYVVLGRLPLSANGKVDRKQLPAPPAEAARAPYLAPRTDAERALAEIWSEVLGRGPIGADDDFFALGGHSLAAARIATRVRERLGARISLGDLFRSPSLAELAASLERGADPSVDAAPIPRGDDDGPFPLAPAQQRLWLWQEMNPGGAAYNVPVALRLRGAIDAAVLERALAALVLRHDALRTRFVVRDGTPAQEVAADPPLPVAMEELWVDGDAGAAIRRRLSLAAARPFDLAAGPPFRALLLRHGGDEHVLLLVIHHVVWDGWSATVFLRELAEVYNAFSRGEPSPLAPAALRYGDYARWHRARLAEVEAEQLAWWRERLAGSPALLELPTDRPRPSAQSHRGAQYPIVLPVTLVERARALGREHGATLHAVLLAAIDVVLARHARAAEVVIGSAHAGRGHPDTEPLVGFFVNTLPIRADLGADPEFRALVRQLRDRTVEAYERADVPFDRLVEALAFPHARSHAPLVQVALSFGEAPAAGLRFGGAVARQEWVDAGTAQFDLTFLLEEEDGGVTGVLEYATDLFDAATAGRIATHLGVLLEAAVARPETRVSRLPLAPAEERERVLAWSAGARATFSADGALHHRFEARAAARPDAVAVTLDGASLTYAELNARANRLARRLVALGVRAEARVGLCAERSLELVVGVLAIVKAGGAYVPLDPAYPAERLAYMADDSGIRVLLAQDAVRDRVATGGIEIVSLDEDFVDESSEDLDRSVSPENLAYVIYTSGSTGRPKGVGVTHANVLRLFDSTAAEFDFGERDVWTLFHSYAFDFSVWELWGALLYGARLIVVPFSVSRDPAAFRKLLAAERVTVLNQTPSAFRALAGADDAEPEPLAALRTVIFGGEALQYEALRGWLDRYGPRRPRLVNMYGITETTVHVTWHTVTGRELRGAGAGSGVGVPIPDLRAYVLDPAGSPAPIGVPGELHVGGAGLARGYLGRPSLTADRFVPDPFSGDAGARLYRSGDLARWKADGTLEYLGRIDQQVKIRGFRIELGEIEALLLAQPSLAAGAVIVRGEGEEAAIVAYVVPAGEPVSQTALRDALKAHLPEYMLPAAFVSIERIPLTTNGKLDRAALPAPESAQVAQADRYAAPKTPVEEVVAGIWGEVLRRDRIGTDENFFAIGGHSLLAMRVAARLRDVFGTELTVTALFQASTIAELAARIEAARQVETRTFPPIVPVPRDTALPLSFAQERLWFLDRLNPGSAFYNVPVVLRISGALHVAALERTLGEIIRRHEVLRTTLREVDGTPVQIVAPFSGFALPVEAAADEDAAWWRARDEARRPFDVASGPLFRPRLVSVSDNEHLLLLFMHHLVTDGWSAAVLYREMRSLYTAFRDGTEPTLAEPAVQYADFAAWERAQLRGDVLERGIAWWRERLDGAPTLLELPTDRPRPSVQSFRGATVPLELAPALVGRLEALARGEGVTLYMVLFGAFQLLLARYARTDDVVVGSPIAGRTRHETEGLIGFFVNTLALRTDLSGDPPFRDVLRRVREVTLGGYEHQDVPFERLVEELRPERSLSHEPIFQVMFDVHDAAGAEAALPGATVSEEEIATATAQHDLLLAITRSADGASGTITFAADLWEPATIERMAAHYCAVLEAVSAAPDTRVSRVPLLADDERERVLAWSAGAGERLAVEGALHRRFEARAAARPDAVAVTLDGASLTYAELNARANRLARRLVALGVRAEARVGLCAERSLELVVGVLAIVKAGGAYVPLDPAYPAERLAYMAEDSGIRVLLAQDAVRDRVSIGDIQIVSLDGDTEDESSDDLPIAVSAENLAYVIYTSGSTGRPKGVGVTHANVLRLFDSTAAELGFGETDAWTLFHSYAFDFSVWELWGALLYGGRLIVVPFSVSRNPAAFRKLLATERVTVLNQTPSAFRALAEADEAEAEPLAALRTVIFGGEALRYEALRGWLDRYGPRRPRLVNMYGITETTVHVTWHTVTGRELRGAGAGSGVGVPIPDLRAYVLDPAGSPAPIGVPGELHVGGAGLARGYLGRPSLTAQRFVPDPFSGDAGARLYRSGDLARWKADGTLEYLGRIDQQVKIRGFRIELGEIEALLLAQPSLAAAAVIVRGEGEEAAIVAYVVPAGEPVSQTALRDALKAHLPEYMLPAAFVPIERIPMTTNGKLDRAALPAPEAVQVAQAERYAAPKTPVEEVVAGIWGEVLRRDRIGTDENFFAIGGHSLLAMRVAARLREVFGIDLKVTALFEAATVAELAARIDAARRGAGLS